MTLGTRRLISVGVNDMMRQTAIRQYPVLQILRGNSCVNLLRWSILARACFRKKSVAILFCHRAWSLFRWKTTDMTSFAFRIGSLMITILAFSIISTGALSIHKFEQTLSDLLKTRFEFVVGQIREGVEAQLDLGLALENLQVNDIIAVYSQDDREVLSIEFFDSTGEVIYSSDPSSVGDLISEEWFNTWRFHSDSPSWAVEDSDASVLGVPVRNNFGQNVGAVVLRYSRDYLNQSVAGQVARILTVDAAAMIVAILIAFLCAFRMMRKTCRELNSMGEVLEETISESVSESSQLQRASRYPEFRGFIESVLGAYKGMNKTMSEARSLDEWKQT